MLRRLARLARSMVGPPGAGAAEGTDATLGLTPIGRSSDDDIFMVGYPKSGSTWWQNLVAGIVYGVDPEFAPPALIHTLVPDVHYEKHYKRYRTPTFFKSHALPSPGYRRVAYLLRDGRDVMVSYYHHRKVMKGNEANFLSMVRDGKLLFPCRWHEHVEAWLSNPHGAEMIVLKYEDLKLDPLPELRRFCDFAGVDRDDALLSSMVAKTSFEKMREKEARFGAYNPEWPKDQPFVRRGKIGSYKDEMPPEVTEIFLEQSRDTLGKCGYLSG